MYGAGSTPPLAGGVIGGGLAATGTHILWPIVVVALGLIIGGALLLRSRYIQRHHNTLSA